MKIKEKRQKGITLIALVITIIILIILAGVSISLIGGQDGIISKAQEAKEKSRGSQIKEAVELASITNAVEENKVTKASIIEELKAKGQLTEEERQALVESDTITIGDIEIDFSILEGNGTPKQTLASQITATNYGDKVNYQVAVNGVTLGNGTNGELDYWKIFYKNPSTNEVILIYGDYLPNSTGLAASAGLGTRNTTGVYLGTTQDDGEVIHAQYFSILNDTSKWSDLLNGNVDLRSKATAKGAIDEDTWISSWNDKGYIRLERYDGNMKYLAEYYDEMMDWHEDLRGVQDKLYIPHDDYGDNYSLGTLSPDGQSIVVISLYSSAHIGGYSVDDRGDSALRPAIYLSTDVSTTGKDAGGAWVIE